MSVGVRDTSSYGDAMLRITTDSSKDTVRLRLEGRLAGSWVHELERCWIELSSERRRGAVVDLAGVIAIGEDGRRLLVTMWEQGAVFHATNCLTRSIVENITGCGPT